MGHQPFLVRRRRIDQYDRAFDVSVIGQCRGSAVPMPQSATSSRYSRTMVRPAGPASPPPRPSRTPPPPPPEGRVRLSFTLTRQVIERITALADAQGISTNDFVRRAIADEVYLQEQIAKGSIVLLRDRDGKYRELEI
jgi:hypothetical protein